MITTATNKDNDMYLGADGNIATAVGIEAVGQTAVHYASTASAEMIHEYDRGVPFFQTVFARDVSIPQFEAALRRRILQAPDVTGIASLEVFQDGDVLRYTAFIETNYGQAQING